jgi:hypothetical protein
MSIFKVPAWRRLCFCGSFLLFYKQREPVQTALRQYVPQNFRAPGCATAFKKLLCSSVLFNLDWR